MVASLDSEFLQLPVLKEHILCNKVNTVKGQELQELRGQIPGYLFIDVFIFQFGSKLIEKPKQTEIQKKPKCCVWYFCSL